MSEYKSEQMREQKTGTWGRRRMEEESYSASVLQDGSENMAISDLRYNSIRT